MAAQPEPDVPEPRRQTRVSLRARPDHRQTRALWATLLGAAGLFSIGAGVIHAATVGYQYGESALYGWTFVAFAIGQIGWGALANALPSRRIAILGILGNAAVLVIWVITRTTGPPVGPGSGAPLPVTFPDAVATTLEGLTVAGGLVALGLSRTARQMSSALRGTIWAIAAAVAVPLATLGVLAQMGVISSLPAAS
jgi:hypothetical protein